MSEEIKRNIDPEELKQSKLGDGQDEPEPKPEEPNDPFPGAGNTTPAGSSGGEVGGEGIEMP